MVDSSPDAEYQFIAHRQASEQAVVTSTQALTADLGGDAEASFRSYIRSSSDLRMTASSMWALGCL
jgi:hypothetical protein